MIEVHHMGGAPLIINAAHIITVNPLGAQAAIATNSEMFVLQESYEEVKALLKKAGLLTAAPRNVVGFDRDSGKWLLEEPLRHDGDSNWKSATHRY